MTLHRLTSVTMGVPNVEETAAYLDGAGRIPATANGTLEVVLPDWQWRRRTWAPHPACGCGALPATAGTIRSLTCGTMSE